MLKLKKPKTDKKVQWDESAVDNEFMGKKTSKCKLYSRYQIIYTSPNLLLKTEGPVLARQSLMFNSPIFTAESVQKSF